MKHKVSDLEGALLDAAVGMALGLRVARRCDGHFCESDVVARVIAIEGAYGGPSEVAFMPSHYWGHGGPILEREGISVTLFSRRPEKEWHACRGRGARYSGSTILIAGMRCFVASQLGEEVELIGEHLSTKTLDCNEKFGTIKADAVRPKPPRRNAWGFFHFRNTSRTTQCSQS